MKRHLSILVVMILFSASALNASPVCDAVSALQRIYVAQQRMAQDPKLMRASRDRSVIRTGLKTLSRDNVAHQLGSRLTSDEMSLIAATLRSARLLEIALENNNMQAALELASASSVERRASQLRYLLPRFGCHVQPSRLLETGSSRAIRAFSKESLQHLGPAAWIIFAIALGAIILCLQIPKMRAKMRQKRRRAKRYEVHLAAHFVLRQKIMRGTVVDISCHGLKLKHSCTAPECNEVLDVWLLDDWQKGTVTWANEHYCGVDFGFPLVTSQVREIRRTQSTVATQKTKTAPV